MQITVDLKVTENTFLGDNHFITLKAAEAESAELLFKYSGAATVSMHCVKPEVGSLPNIQINKIVSVTLTIPE